MSSLSLSVTVCCVDGIREEINLYDDEEEDGYQPEILNVHILYIIRLYNGKPSLGVDDLRN